MNAFSAGSMMPAGSWIADVTPDNEVMLDVVLEHLLPEELATSEDGSGRRPHEPVVRSGTNPV